MKDIIKAINFSFIKHKNQKRRGTGMEYVVHPIIVNEFVQYYFGKVLTYDEIKILKICSLLHDTLEDTNTSYNEIKTIFGDEVAKITLELTSNEELLKKKGKNEYLKNKMINMSSSALSIKLLDRLSNILDNPRDKYVVDTINLMNFLLCNKNINNINSIQIKIIEDIITLCNEIKDNK